MLVESRLYVITLFFCIALSFISIMGNFVSGFPFAINIKWIALLVVAVLAYITNRQSRHTNLGMLLFFIFVVGIFLPFAFIDSGGSNNNALGYTFMLLVVITYLFKGKEQLYLIILLIFVFLALLLLQYFYPEIIMEYDRYSQLIDRLIQVPIQLVAIFLVVKQFSNAYYQANMQLEKERSRLQDSMERLALSEKQLQLSNMALEQLSVTDKLTQVHNRMKLDEVLDIELARTVRDGKSFSVILIDIDHFKLVNDTFGHQVGDKVLIEFAKILKENLRKTDIVGRWGGEEFLIISPNSSSLTATKTAEKLRNIIANSQFPGVKKITGSFGLTSYLAGDAIDDMLARADEALYLAKKNGRNRVEVK